MVCYSRFEKPTYKNRQDNFHARLSSSTSSCPYPFLRASVVNPPSSLPDSCSIRYRRFGVIRYHPTPFFAALF